MSDSASLQNLHDIVAPGAVAWWPPAPGWYAVMAVAVTVLVVLLWKYWRHWRRNRYRGAALKELDRLGRDAAGGDLSELPVLLKRAALSAWPRQQVAGLVGEDWHRFLDQSVNTELFHCGAGVLLDRLSYAPGDGTRLSREEKKTVLDAARMWLEHHRVPADGD
jgi:hypothetical protein